jgi:hypothetical protein
MDQFITFIVRSTLSDYVDLLVSTDLYAVPVQSCIVGWPIQVPKMPNEYISVQSTKLINSCAPTYSALIFRLAVSDFSFVNEITVILAHCIIPNPRFRQSVLIVQVFLL